MEKPDDIPQDVWDVASTAVGGVGTYTNGLLSHLVLLERVARAILDERQRLPDAIDLYRLLKSQKLRARRDIAKAVAQALRTAS